jgi:hypothetical protein
MGRSNQEGSLSDQTSVTCHGDLLLGQRGLAHDIDFRPTHRTSCVLVCNEVVDPTSDGLVQAPAQDRGK